MATEWRDLLPLSRYAPRRFTTALYQETIAGKPREAGARAALERFGLPDPEARARVYAARKQERLLDLIDAGDIVAFPDALRFLLAVKARHIPIAAASSSKNANLLLSRIRVDEVVEREGLHYGFVRPGTVLLDLFDQNVGGADFRLGKPHPDIFLAAARALGVAAALCLVIEDAPSGVRAGKAGGMIALGVARLGDEALLVDAGADCVVRSLDEISVLDLVAGRLKRAAA
jgi:beta-phosphoglucomutase-like phosphatase (HAD superfamily)